MSRFLSSLVGLASGWAYAAVGLMAALEAAAFIGLVIPGESALLIGGFLAYRGSVSLPWMMAVAALGAVIGDSVGYEIGRRFGPTLKDSRLGHRIGDARWHRAEAYLERKGGRAVFLGRFIGVLRALVPAIAGLSGMPYRRFLAWNAAGGLIWGPAFVFLGYLAGPSYARLEKIVGHASWALLLLVAAIAGAVHWYHSRAEARRPPSRQ